MLRVSSLVGALALTAFAPNALAQTCLNTINPYAANNGGSVGGAVYFDVAVTGGVIIQAIESNCGATVGTPCGMDVYTIPGTSVGNQTNPGLWTLVGTDNGTTTSAGRDGVTRFTLQTPIVLTSGTYGMALVARGTAHAYTNGTGANQNFSDSFLNITLGQASNVPWTGIINPRVWNGALCYVPAAGIYPDFTATPRSGNIPLNVQFTDTTYTSDPNGVQQWAWDLDGDNVADSAVQNPTFTYGLEGIYNVSLSVTDTQNPTATVTKTGYIAVDVVDASFTTTPIGATTVQFNDTSAGNPTSWAWDFQNDGIVDSTARNPIFNYPAPGSYQVKLDVADAISTDSTTVNLGVSILPIPAFGSTFSSATLTRGFYFQAPTRFSIVSAKVPDESNHGLQNVAIYRLAAAPPAFAGTASGGLEFFSAGQPSATPVSCAVSFEAGEWVGVLGACGDASTMRNSYATPAGPFSSSIFGSPTTLFRFITQTNIVATSGNGAYSSENAAALARVELGISNATGISYGAGTPSGSGNPAPTLRTTALPRLGTTAELTVTQQDTAFGVLLLALGRSNLPLPFGTLLVDPLSYQLSFTLNNGAPLNVGATSYQLPVPNDPVLNGAGPVTFQNVNLVPGSPNQLSLSNGQEWFAGF